ncbi:MAG TPA: PEGA domain-containing protein [Phycisphaerae bacterium]|nr:PEGA domain-containing protein [Phycisphaerae bacterium]
MKNNTKILLTAGLLTWMVIICGCVEREWTIRSEPEGAVVYVSNVEVGRTPVTIDFTWYGDYDVTIRKDGYDTLDTHVKIDPPWFEWVGVDLFSEIAPWTYYDRRETLHILQKRHMPNENELIQKAKDLQKETGEGRTTPFSRD